jgi:transposase-like protein
VDWQWTIRQFFDGFRSTDQKSIRESAPFLKLAGTSYRLDETYIKVGWQWKYLYRALDKEGNTIEFMLSANRDIPAAKRFFKKMMRADHQRLLFSISVHKHASYPKAFTASQKRESAAQRLQAAADGIPDQHRRTGPQIHSPEVASDAMLPLLPYS